MKQHPEVEAAEEGGGLELQV